MSYTNSIHNMKIEGMLSNTAIQIDINKITATAQFEGEREYATTGSWESPVYPKAVICEIGGKVATPDFEFSMDMRGSNLLHLKPGIYAAQKDLMNIRVEYEPTSGVPLGEDAISGLIEIMENSFDSTHPDNPIILQNGNLGLRFSLKFSNANVLEGSFFVQFGKPTIEVTTGGVCNNK